eukprot:6185944-Pleurochrysis_carterae.AAC.1
MESMMMITVLSALPLVVMSVVMSVVMLLMIQTSAQNLRELDPHAVCLYQGSHSHHASRHTMLKMGRAMLWQLEATSESGGRKRDARRMHGRTVAIQRRDACIRGPAALRGERERWAGAHLDREASEESLAKRPRRVVLHVAQPNLRENDRTDTKRQLD